MRYLITNISNPTRTSTHRCPTVTIEGKTHRDAMRRRLNYLSKTLGERNWRQADEQWLVTCISEGHNGFGDRLFGDARIYVIKVEDTLVSTPVAFVAT